MRRSFLQLLTLIGIIISIYLLKPRTFIWEFLLLFCAYILTIIGLISLWKPQELTDNWVIGVSLIAIAAPIAENLRNTSGIEFLFMCIMASSFAIVGLIVLWGD